MDTKMNCMDCGVLFDPKPNDGVCPECGGLGYYPHDQLQPGHGRVTWTPPDISKNPYHMEFKMDTLTKKLTESGACQCKYYGCDAKTGGYGTSSGFPAHAEGGNHQCLNDATTVVTDEDETPIPCCQSCANQMVNFGGGYYHYTESKKKIREAEGFLPPAIRSQINAALIARGLDGNGHFGSLGQALLAIDDLLRGFPEVDATELYMSGVFNENDGRHTFELTYNLAPVKNAMLVMTWHQRYPFPSDRPKDYEIIAYVS